MFCKKDVLVQLLPTRQDKASYRLDSLARSIAKISKKITFILLAFLAEPAHRYFFFFLREILHQRAMIVSSTHSNLIVLLLIP